MTQPIKTFRIARDFPLDVDRMWGLLTDPKARTLWGGPSDDVVLIMDVADLREGGQERHRCGPADNPEFVVDTHWYHLDTPKSACFSETVSAGGTRFGVSLVTYALTGAETGSVLTVDVAVASMTGEDMVGDFEEGWTSGLNRLTRMIEDGTLT